MFKKYQNNPKFLRQPLPVVEAPKRRQARLSVSNSTSGDRVAFFSLRGEKFHIFITRTLTSLPVREKKGDGKKKI